MGSDSDMPPWAGFYEEPAGGGDASSKVDDGTCLAIRASALF